MPSTAPFTDYGALASHGARLLTTNTCYSHCNAGPVTATSEETKPNERTDSTVGLDSTVQPTDSALQPEDKTPLCLADFTSCVLSANWEFDLRTKAGLVAFINSRKDLGAHAWGVRSLTLKHWTTWWSFSDNAWTSSEDSTVFSRGENGELLISRALPTPRNQTCQCSMEQLLAQLDPSFTLARCHTVASVQHFVNYLRASDASIANRMTLLDAAFNFEDLLLDHSRFLARDYGLAGSQCANCDMPRLYLCGHLSTGEEKDGAGVVFDARAPSAVALLALQAVRKK